MVRSIASSRVSSRLGTILGAALDTFPFPAGQRVPIYCYGDSTTANSGATYDENNRGIPTMLEFYSNGRIKFLPQNNYAHGGDNSYDFKEYVTGGTPHNDPTDRRPLYVPTNGLCYVDLSANDFGSDAQTYEDFVSNMTTGLQVLLDAGNFIILKNVKPRSTLDAADITQLLQMRAWITAKCASNPMMVEMDGSLAIKSVSDWSIAAGYSLDGLHLNGAGATAITEAAWFEEGLKNFIGTNTFPAGAYDFIDSPFAGTGGSAVTSDGGSFFGDIYDDFTVYTKVDGGTAQAVWTGATIEGGYEITGEVSSATDEGHEYCYITYPIELCNTNDLLALQARIQCTEATNAYWAGMQLVCNPASADRTPYTFSSTTTETDPTSGKVRMNNATASNVTEIYLSKTDSGAVDVGNIVTTWGDADASYIYTIKIYKDNSNYHSFYIIGDIVDNGTWITIPVEHISTTGTVSDTNAVKVFPSAVVEAVGGYGAEVFIDTDFIKEHVVAGLGETRKVKVMGGWTRIEARLNVGLTRFVGQDSSVTARITKLQVDRDIVPLAISGTPTVDCEAGTAYAGFTPTVVGGTTPYTFSIASGTLPTGLSLNTSTGAITGTPTVAEMYNDIVLRVTDAFGLTDDLLAFDMEITEAPSIPFMVQETQDNGSGGREPLYVTIASGAASPASAKSLDDTFDMSTSFALGYGLQTTVLDETYTIRDMWHTIAMTSTTLSTTRGNASTSATSNLNYYIAGVQLPLTLVDSVQTKLCTLTGTQGQGAAVGFNLDTSVAKSRSVAFVQSIGGQRSASTSIVNADHRVDISSDGTQVEVTASSLLGSSTRYVNVTVIQFKTGVVRSKQDFSASVSASSATGSATLTSVTTGNTIVFPRGVLQSVASTSAPDQAFTTMHLASGTSVEVERVSGASTAVLTAYGTALELEAGYVSVQHKKVSATGTTTGDVTITSSPADSSFLFITGFNASITSNSNESRYFFKLVKTSDTNVRVTKWTATNNVTVSFQVVDVLV